MTAAMRFRGLGDSPNDRVGFDDHEGVIIDRIDRRSGGGLKFSRSKSPHDFTIGHTLLHVSLPFLYLINGPIVAAT